MICDLGGLASSILPVFEVLLSYLVSHMSPSEQHSATYMKICYYVWNHLFTDGHMSYTYISLFLLLDKGSKVQRSEIT